MQWYLDAWKIDEAWQISRGDGVTVAVVDTGVNAGHADLKGQVLSGPLGDGDGDVTGKGHGTEMAANIAGTGKGAGGQGASGVAPGAKILPYRTWIGPDVLTDNLASAIRSAADSPAQIINLSLGASPRPALAEAIDYALQRGKLVVAGAGNLSKYVGDRVYPAAYPGVLGVGAFDRNGTAWTGGNQGDWISLSGPGVDVVTACNGPTGYCRTDGTSDATALVSGVAALVWSVHPSWTANQVIKVLIDSANKPFSGKVPSDSVGFGGVSPRNALKWTGDPGPPGVNPLVGVRGDKPVAAAPATPTDAPSTPGAAELSVPPPAPTPEVVATNSTNDSGGSGLWPLLGAVVGGVVVLGSVGVLAYRGRRER